MVEWQLLRRTANKGRCDADSNLQPGGLRYNELTTALSEHPCRLFGILSGWSKLLPHNTDRGRVWKYRAQLPWSWSLLEWTDCNTAIKETKREFQSVIIKHWQIQSASTMFLLSSLTLDLYKFMFFSHPFGWLNNLNDSITLITLKPWWL